MFEGLWIRIGGGRPAARHQTFPGALSRQMAPIWLALCGSLRAARAGSTSRAPEDKRIRLRAYRTL